MNRRTTVFLVVVVVVAASVMALLATHWHIGIERSRQDAIPWTNSASIGLRGDAAHTGTQPGPAPVGPLVVLWDERKDQKQGIDPTVANGMVYLIGYDERTILAVDAVTGGVVWTVPTDTMPPKATLVVWGNTLFYEDFQKMGMVHALNATTGAPIRSFGPYCYCVIASFTLADGILFIGVQGDGSYGDLYAVDAVTGKRKWRVELDQGAPSVAPAVGAGVVVVTNGSVLRTFDPATGKQLWSFHGSGGISRTPTIADGSIVLQDNDTRLITIDAKTGSERWRWQADAPIFGAIAVADGAVFVSTRSRAMVALDLASGTTRWQVKGLGIGAPTVVDGMVYVIGYARESTLIVAIDASTGREAWRAGLPALQIRTPVSNPSILGGVIYLIDADHSMFALGHDTATTSDGRTRTPTGSRMQFWPE